MSRPPTPGRRQPRRPRSRRRRGGARLLRPLLRLRAARPGAAGMAFVDMGDQFLALAEGRSAGRPTTTATSASSSTTRRPSAARSRRRASRSSRAAASTSATRGGTASRSSTTATSSSRRRPEILGGMGADPAGGEDRGRRGRAPPQGDGLTSHVPGLTPGHVPLRDLARTVLFGSKARPRRDVSPPSPSATARGQTPGRGRDGTRRRRGLAGALGAPQAAQGPEREQRDGAERDGERERRPRSARRR